MVRTMSKSLSFVLLQVYVSENNLYYQRNPNAPAERVTSTGQHNVIYNGVADWTYQGKDKDRDKDKDTFIGPQEFVVHMTI